jgi:hypothetical protein
LFLSELTLNKEESTLTNTHHELSDLNNSDSVIENEKSLRINWVSHPDGYDVAIPHKLYNPSDYGLTANKYSNTMSVFSSPTSIQFKSIKLSSFLTTSKREYHTDLSEGLGDLDKWISPRPTKVEYNKTDEASKEFNKNWKYWNYNLTSSVTSLWDGGLQNIFRSFWDEILANTSVDNKVPLVLRLKLYDGTTRHVTYVSFYPKNPKKGNMFDRIYFILNKEFQDKTEYIHTKEEEKQITGVVFKYQILTKEVNTDNENTKSEVGVSKSNSPSIIKSSSIGGKREYHTVVSRKHIEYSSKDLFLNIFNYIACFLIIFTLFITFIEILPLNSFSPIIDPVYGTTFLASLLFTVQPSEELVDNSNSASEDTSSNNGTYGGSDSEGHNTHDVEEDWIYGEESSEEGPVDSDVATQGSSIDDTESEPRSDTESGSESDSPTTGSESEFDDDDNMPDEFVAAYLEELTEATVNLIATIRDIAEAIFEEPSDNMGVEIFVPIDDADDDDSDGPSSDDGMGIFLDTAMIVGAGDDISNSIMFLILIISNSKHLIKLIKNNSNKNKQKKYQQTKGIILPQTSCNYKFEVNNYKQIYKAPPKFQIQKQKMKDLSDLFSVHANMLISAGWLTREEEIRPYTTHSPERLVNTECAEAYMHFYDNYLEYEIPWTKPLFSLSLRLDDNSLLEIVPLVWVSGWDIETEEAIIEGLLQEKHAQWHNSDGSSRVTHIVTKGRIVRKENYKDWLDTPHIRDLWKESFDHDKQNDEK